MSVTARLASGRSRPWHSPFPLHHILLAAHEIRNGEAFLEAFRVTPSTRVLFAIFVVFGYSTDLAAAPIAVRLVEGTAHGLLLVRSMSGENLGHGDFLQAAYPDRIESRLVLRFKDGSLHDETVAFSQQRVFTMMSYRLVQRGPSFPEMLEAALDRTTRPYFWRAFAP